MALDLGWMTKSPIRRHKSKRIVVQREVLTEAELKRIEDLELGDHAALAGDLFLVQCYTELTYIDLKSVSEE